MENYTLLKDEVVLFEDDINIRETTGTSHLILTNQNLIIVSRKEIQGEVSVTIYPVSEIKVYNNVPQVKQQKETITVYLISGEIAFSFASIFKSVKFMTKAKEVITGKGIAARGANKVKNAIGLVDDTLGINIMETVTGVVKIIRSKETDTSDAGKADKYTAIANCATAVIQAARGNNNTVLQSNQSASIVAADMTYEQRVENMKKLKELLDIGILTSEEFDIKKKEIMGL